MFLTVYSRMPRRPHLLPSGCLALLAVCAANATAGFTPNVDLLLEYDDNVRASSDELKRDDLILAVHPLLAWQWLVGKHQFDLSYAGGYGFYRDDSDLDYQDHSLSAHGLFDHSHRLNSELELGYQLGHDRPGDTDAVAKLVDETNTWSSKTLLTRIAYGRNDSQGQIVLQLDYELRRNTNDDQAFRDYDKLGTTGTFYYRIAPSTRLLLEAALADYRYPNQDAIGTDQSNQSGNFLTGVSWQISAKTSGEFKIGYRSTRYDEAVFEDRSGLALALEGNWNPNTYTQVNFGATQETRQSALEATGGYVHKGLHASLQHAFTPRTTLQAQASVGRSSYEDSSDRDSRKQTFGLGITHDLLRWLDIGAEYRQERQTSDDELNSYRRNLFMLKASSKFE